MSRWPRTTRRIGVAAALVLALSALAGCGKPSLRVEAPRTVNGGRPVYMLVRTVDQPKFAADSYGSVVARVASPDDSVVMTEVIYPGTQPSFSLKAPEKGQLAVYFFFRSPAGDWKMLLDNPLSRAVSIKLGDDHIEPQ